MKSPLRFIAACFVFALFACSAQHKASPNPTEEVAVTHAENQIDYVELAAEDLSAVKKFYAAAFGWEFQDWGPDYASFSGAGLDGGFRGGEAPVAGSTLIILHTDDLEASEQRVTDAGGEITERHDFPGGRRFHFRDPAGNILGVWTPVEAED